MQHEGPVRDVRQLEHLAAVHAGGDEARSDMDGEPETGEAAAPLEPACYVLRELDALARDAEHRLARLQHVGHLQPLDRRGRAVIGRIGHGDRFRAAVHHADLVAEVEIDRGRSHLVGHERIDDDSARGELAQDDVAGEDHGGGV